MSSMASTRRPERAIFAHLRGNAVYKVWWNDAKAMDEKVNLPNKAILVKYNANVVLVQMFILTREVCSLAISVPEAE